jgi:hypothetical protein
MDGSEEIPEMAGRKGAWLSAKPYSVQPLNPEVGVPRLFDADSFLKKLDIDGDGKISYNELRKHVSEYEKMEIRSRNSKRIILILVAVFIVLSMMIGFLTYGAVEISKESNVEGNVMVSKETGEAVQCANTDLYVDSNGDLVARSSSSRGSRRLAEGRVDADAPLGVRRTFKKKELASTLPFQYFKEVEWLEIESETGKLCHTDHDIVSTY